MAFLLAGVGGTVVFVFLLVLLFVICGRRGLGSVDVERKEVEGNLEGR